MNAITTTNPTSAASMRSLTSGRRHLIKAATAHVVGRVAGSARMAFAASLVALFLLSGVAGPLAPRSAEAATSVNIRACLYFSPAGGEYARYPVALKDRNGKTVKSGNTGADGCATFYKVTGNSCYYVHARLVLKTSSGRIYAQFEGKSDLACAGSSGTWGWDYWIPVYG